MTDNDRLREITFARERARRTLPVTVLVLLGIVSMYLPLPKRFIGVIPLVIAIVLTVRLLQFLTGRRGRERFWPILTLVLVGMLLSSLALQAVFYKSVVAYEDCTAGALTSQAQADCDVLRDESPLGAGFTLN